MILLFTACVTTYDKNNPKHFKPEPKQGFGAWVSPTDSNVILTQKFRPPKNPRHRGIDLAGKTGQPIYATRSGKIVYAGQKFRGYGKMILLEHDSTWTSLYSHLTRYKVRSGEQVRQGQIIGYMGRTGRASGVHLHFEIYKNKVPQDPLSLVPIKYRRR